MNVYTPTPRDVTPPSRRVAPWHRDPRLETDGVLPAYRERSTAWFVAPLDHDETQHLDFWVAETPEIVADDGVRVGVYQLTPTACCARPEWLDRDDRRWRVGTLLVGSLIEDLAPLVALEEPFDAMLRDAVALVRSDDPDKGDALLAVREDLAQACVGCASEADALAMWGVELLGIEYERLNRPRNLDWSIGHVLNQLLTVSFANFTRLSPDRHLPEVEA